VDWLTQKMQERDFTVSALHNDMDQDQHARAIREFRSGASRVLITSIAVDRFIDHSGVSVIIN